MKCKQSDKFTGSLMVLLPNTDSLAFETFRIIPRIIQACRRIIMYPHFLLQ